MARRSACAALALLALAAPAGAAEPGRLLVVEPAPGHERAFAAREAAPVGREVRSVAGSDGYMARVTRDELRRLRLDPAVRIRAPFRAGLATALPVVRQPAAEAFAGGDLGRGARVGIVGSGVYHPHGDLGLARVAGEACFSTPYDDELVSTCPGGATRSTAAGSGRECRRPGCEHETHVAGIAVGRKGTAQAARYYSVQAAILPRDATLGGPEFTEEDVAAAIDHLRQAGVEVINVSLWSLGRPEGDCSADFPLVAAAIGRAADAGIPVVTIAGNGGEDFVAAPGCIARAVTVASVNDNLAVSSFSGFGDLVDLVAPGRDIVSAVKGGTRSMSGTSMSAGFVSGTIAALIAEAPGTPLSGVLRALSCGSRKAARGGVARRVLDVRAALGCVR